MTGRDNGSDIPRHPFYKDERIVGGRITVRVSLRLLIASLLAFVFLMGFLIVRLIDATDANHGLAVKIAQTQEQYHISRLEAQRQTDAKIQELVCLVIKDAPDTKPLVKKLRLKYQCPAYSKAV